jgi:voltage-gated potassium channel
VEWIFTGLFLVECLVRRLVGRRPLAYALSLLGIIALLAIRTLRLLRVFRIFKLGRFVGAGGLTFPAWAGYT